MPTPTPTRARVGLPTRTAAPSVCARTHLHVVLRQPQRRRELLDELAPVVNRNLRRRRARAHTHTHSSMPAAAGGAVRWRRTSRDSFDSPYTLFEPVYGFVAVAATYCPMIEVDPPAPCTQG